MSTSMEPSQSKTMPDVVRPLMTPEAAKAQWDVYEKLKTQLLVSEDYQPIRGKKYIKRSGFRKIAVFFGISDRILKEERLDRPDGSFVWRIVVETVAPNGRTSVGVGACDSKERNWAHVEHDCYSTAHTRAKSRAISDMIAGGIVSAEEMDASPPGERTVPGTQVPGDKSLPPLPWEVGPDGWEGIPANLERTDVISLFNMLESSDGQMVYTWEGKEYLVEFRGDEQDPERFIVRKLA